MRCATKMLSVGLVLLMAGAVPAATINYRVLIDGVHADVHDVLPGATFQVEIWVNCPDSEAYGFYGGVLQYSVNLLDSTGIVGLMDAEEGTLPFPPFVTGSWVSSSVPHMVNFAGEVDTLGYDVYCQTGRIPPGDWTTYWDEFGAGPGVWDLVGYGNFIAGEEVGEAVLALVPFELTGMVVSDATAGGSNFGAYPEAAFGDETIINIVPEPVSLSLMGAGLIGIALRKRMKPTA